MSPNEATASSSSTARCGTSSCYPRADHLSGDREGVRREPGLDRLPLESKDQLTTKAMVATLDRWLDEVADALEATEAADPAARFDRAAHIVTRTSQEHIGLLKTFISSLSVALGDAEVRAILVDGITRTWPVLASLLGAGDDQTGRDAAGLVLSMFYGQMIQATLDPALALDEQRMTDALRRLRGLLPD